MFRSRKAQDPAPSFEDMVVIVDRAVNPYLVLFHDPTSFRAEQLRSLRNRLVALNPDGASKSLVVTSAVRAEGNTVTAINLSIALSELERHSVLLVDGDMRRPSVERYLNLNPAVGLADLVAGAADLDDAVRPAGIRNLSILGAGRPVAGPSELLTTPRIDELFARLKERFQYVIVDTPPALPATEAGLLASCADGTLLVLRLEHSTRGHTRDAMQNLQHLGANIMGCFVTQERSIDPESNPRFFYDDGEED
jgi:capsular exopolysaccharide synthesis family protein